MCRTPYEVLEFNSDITAKNIIDLFFENLRSRGFACEVLMVTQHGVWKVLIRGSNGPYVYRLMPVSEELILCEGRSAFVKVVDWWQYPK